MTAAPREIGQVQLSRSYATVTVMGLEQHGRIVVDLVFASGDTRFMLHTPDEVRSFAAALREAADQGNPTAVVIDNTVTKATVTMISGLEYDLIGADIDFTPGERKERRQVRRLLIMTNNEARTLAAVFREAANLRTLTHTPPPPAPRRRRPA